MSYFNYHAKVKKLIRDKKLKNYYLVEEYHGIRPALILEFNDEKYKILPIRFHRWEEYFDLIDKYKNF